MKNLSAASKHALTTLAYNLQDTHQNGIDMMKLSHLSIRGLDDLQDKGLITLINFPFSVQIPVQVTLTQKGVDLAHEMGLFKENV